MAGYFEGSTISFVRETTIHSVSNEEVFFFFFFLPTSCSRFLVDYDFMESVRKKSEEFQDLILLNII